MKIWSNAEVRFTDPSRNKSRWNKQITELKSNHNRTKNKNQPSDWDRSTQRWSAQRTQLCRHAKYCKPTGNITWSRANDKTINDIHEHQSPHSLSLTSTPDCRAECLVPSAESASDAWQLLGTRPVRAVIYRVKWDPKRADEVFRTPLVTRV